MGIVLTVINLPVPNLLNQEEPSSTSIEAGQLGVGLMSFRESLKLSEKTFMKRMEEAMKPKKLCMLYC